MSLTLHAPCSRVDLGEVFGEVSPFAWTVACQQLATGPSYVVRDGSARALACGGFIPLGDTWENWFHAAPAAAPHMRAVVRLARLTFADLPHSDPRPVETIVRTPAGARLARLLGFRHAITVDGLELWRREPWAVS